jgi:hypothetical protein
MVSGFKPGRKVYINNTLFGISRAGDAPLPRTPSGVFYGIKNLGPGVSDSIADKPLSLQDGKRRLRGQNQLFYQQTEFFAVELLSC